jgi:hypothetical protein
VITEDTRRAIVDEIVARRFDWSGRLEEQDFLARLYDMKELESHDHRFDDAYGDVWKHRVANNDWDDDWVFHDDRFDLAFGPDEVFLRFLAESLHPVLRRRPDEVAEIVEMYNKHLRQDGVELAAATQLAGRPVYAARSTISVPAALRQVERSLSLDGVDYLTQQITRMESAIESDPELAIGTAKELVETCCSTILIEHGVQPDKNWTVARLVKEAAKSLQLASEDVAPGTRAAEKSRLVLGGLGTVVSGLAELRNAYGTGHGKPLGRDGLGSRHARLAVGAASTLSVFLFDSFEEQRRASRAGE